MPAGHWIEDIDGASELEATYNQKLELWKKSIDKDNPKGNYELKRTVNFYSDELRRAREHWRGVGLVAGTRKETEYVSVQNFVDDNGNPLPGNPNFGG